MKSIDVVFETANQFMKDPFYVSIDKKNVKALAKKMKKEGKKSFPKKEIDSEFKTCLLELVGNSINYCYWYGRSDIRPGEASSTKMYELLQDAFKDYMISEIRGNFTECIYQFITHLSLNRFPLLEERSNHLKELLYFSEPFVKSIIDHHEETDFDSLFTILLGTFPGYSSDIFLKRASLFFMQLYRNLGWFEEAMNRIHIPVDYQVPNMLYCYNCTDYSKELYEKVFRNDLILKHSREECEIRASTILICKELCELTGWNVSDIDSWFWLRRKEATWPFHLTITTDY